MLTHLTIQNYALIKHLELKPSSQLNVVTGETGAGKSIMLGAIGLLIGNRADTKVLWDENEKCIIEGTFNIKNYKLKNLFKDEDLDYDDSTVIRREISPGGKSRAFINDTPVTLDVLKKVGAFLMDIHSQHETLFLGSSHFQLELIDTFAGTTATKEKYLEVWEKFQKAKKHLEQLTVDAESLKQESDYINFQLDELKKADLSENEQESLESELKVMEHAEEIKSRFNALIEALSQSEYSVRNGLAEAKVQLQHISQFSQVYDDIYKRLESARLEIEDIAEEIEKEESNIDFDPSRTELVKERLSTIYRLQKKHRVLTVKELLAIQQTLQEKSSLTANLDESLAEAQKNAQKAESEVKSIAKELSNQRQKSFASLSKQIVKLLKELGMPDATLTFDHVVTEPSSSGTDKIEILFSANKGMSPRPLAQVASGGEFSRLMFSIKYVMAEKTSLPTLILDEIDNGVSGEVAIKLGNLMRTMSRDHQLITISHLPQIAAKGDAHYFVYKDSSDKKTVSNIRQLNGPNALKK
jgi:DNA repair protein RecN (Recombination protein N)